jgi:hypothetical protein
MTIARDEKEHKPGKETPRFVQPEEFYCAPWPHGQPTKIDESPVAHSSLGHHRPDDPLTVTVLPPHPKNPAACPDGPAFELYRLLFPDDDPRHGGGSVTSYCAEDPTTGELRLAKHVPTVINSIWASYAVAKEEFDDHDRHAGGRRPVEQRHCPRCKDARAVIEQTEAAVSRIAEALDAGDARAASIEGLRLFNAGVAAGRLQAWQSEAGARFGETQAVVSEVARKKRQEKAEKVAPLVSKLGVTNAGAMVTGGDAAVVAVANGKRPGRGIANAYRQVKGGARKSPQESSAKRCEARAKGTERGRGKRCPNLLGPRQERFCCTECRVRWHRDHPRGVVEP